ncbi:magnesium transporter CorA family protein [Bacteroides sp. 214]|uniref:magnesium transporter CorA family protein n=1 Tax=Bacteroides sp. 214 TaxID=2302935 RepID=UPI0013D3B46D|nr:magnesium transporter CorA family protein [Bacteroides sp. 214]NDW12050.1 magnesium transporter CorA family protein [Bacteroides sp. 214]
MRTFLYCNTGFEQKPEWIPNCWINIECPDAGDLNYLINELKVPESFLKDISDIDERPRLETEGNWLLTIFRVPIPNQKEDTPFTTVPIGVLTNDDLIISVCYHQTEMIPDFIRYSLRKEIQVRNKLDLILRLLHSSSVWFLKYLKQIQIDVKRAERELEKSIRNEDLTRLMKLQSTMVYFNTSIRGNQVVTNRLHNIFSDTDFLDKDLYEDVLIEQEQAYSTVKIYSDILTGTMDAFASIISNNVGTIMKRMTSISIILMVPTLIASFYGMNVDVYVDHIPHAFALIVVASIVLSASAFFVFKKIKWF